MALPHASNLGDNYLGLQVGHSSAPITATFQLPQTRPETPPVPASTILPRPDPSFIDRNDLLERVQAQAAAKQARLALVGLGGVGKTQLAIRYAESLRERDGDTWVLWIFAANAARFEESVREVADQIRLPGRQDPKADILQLWQTWLADARRQWLIVLDNADHADFLLEPSPTADAVRETKPRIDYIPICDHGTVVLTSRSKNEARKFVDDDNIIEVLPMDIVHAQALLEKKLGPLYDKVKAATLATALDFMPLALSQAASYIKQKRKYTIDRYLAELEKSRQSRTSLLRQHGTVPTRDREASSSIILTWQISFEHIHSDRRSAADLLALMSFCDRQAIPEFLLHDLDEAGEDSETEVHDTVTFDDDVEMLENFSFVSPRVDQTTWDMHRLVQDAMYWWLADHGRTEDVRRCYLQRLHKVMPTGDYENWRTCEVLLPHCENGIATISDERESALWQADILYNVAWFAWSQGRAKDAVTSAEASMQSRARWLGQEAEQSASSMDMLALALSAAGRYDAAAELQVKVVEIRQRVLGAEHPDTLTSMSNLASTYSNQGRYEAAAELGAKVLEMRQRLLGAEHPSTLTSMNNLAMMYSGQGRCEDAAELQENVLEICKRVLGAEHPDTLMTMANLAVYLFNQDRLQEAYKTMAQCLHSQTCVLGATHPHTSNSASWLQIMEEKCRAASSQDVAASGTDLTI